LSDDTNHESWIAESDETAAPFRFVARTIPFDQLEHGLLHKIQRLVIVSRGDLCHPKRAAFDPG
jgi:hypothetical protein